MEFVSYIKILFNVKGIFSYKVIRYAIPNYLWIYKQQIQRGDFKYYTDKAFKQ